MKFLALLSLVLLSSTSVASVDPIQSSKATGNSKRANAIKKSYLSSYNEYLKYACKNGKCADQLNPLSKTSSSPFGAFGATLVDSMTTSHVMGLDDQLNQAIKWSEKIDFNSTAQDTISLFETNIRYVASLLSTYELTGKKHKKLITQAKTIGDHLLTGWVGDNKLPYNTLQNWNTYGAPQQNGAIIAETGTIVLEFYKLSKYTGDPKYKEHADKAMLATSQAKSTFPGLKGQGIDPKTNQATSLYITWGGGSDSYFEYLLKYGILLGSTKTWIPSWISAVQSSITHLITKAYKHPELTYLTDYNDGDNIYQFSHLGCFVAGNWLLGGKVLKNQEYFDYGLKLTESCINTYTSEVTGIGPEAFVFVGEGNKRNGITIYNQTFYDQHGFDNSVVDYVLRPEVLESVFYAYRLTGDKKWQDLSWNAFKAIRQYCQAKKGATGAFTAIKTVNSTRTSQLDDSESFLYAELFKYLYLTQSDSSLISLDDYVFNTEGHPFLIEKKADLSGAQADSQQQATPLLNLPSKTNGQLSLPFFSGLPGVKDFNAPRILKDIIGGIESAASNLVSRGEGESKRASDLGHGKLAKQRRSNVL